MMFITDIISALAYALATGPMASRPFAKWLGHYELGALRAHMLATSNATTEHGNVSLLDDGRLKQRQQSVLDGVNNISVHLVHPLWRLRFLISAGVKFVSLVAVIVFRAVCSLSRSLVIFRKFFVDSEGSRSSPMLCRRFCFICSTSLFE